MTRLVVVSGGLGVPSSSRLLADRLAAATTGALRPFGGAGSGGVAGSGGAGNSGAAVEVTTIELRDHARALADTLVTGFAPPELQAAIDAVTAADGLIVVSPVFAASYSGLFKTFFDVLDPVALDGKPVLLGATGGSARHSLVTEHALRPLFSYLRAVVVPTAVFAATDDFGDAAGVELTKRITRAAAQLAALLAPVPTAAALAAEPVQDDGSHHDDGSDHEVPDFADLLATVASGGKVTGLRW